MGSLKRLICAFRGHEEYMHFEKNRVYWNVPGVHASPGWTIDSRRPVLQFQSRRMKTPGHTVIRKIA